MAEHLIAQLRLRVKFLTSQSNAGIDRVQLQAKCVDTLECLFKQQRITLDEVIQVSNEVNEGPWDSDQRVRLAGAISDACADGPSTIKRSRNAQTQTCMGIASFLQRWWWDAALDKDVSEGAILKHLSMALYMLGITSPSEHTLKIAIAVMIAVRHSDGDGVDPAKRRSLCRELQSQVKSLVRHHGEYPLGCMVDYPTKPSDLSDNMYKHAYAKGGPMDPPEDVARLIPLIVDGIKIRKSASCFQGDLCATQKALGSTPQGHMNFGDASMMNVVTGLARGMMMTFGSQTGAGSPNIHLSQFEPRGSPNIHLSQFEPRGARTSAAVDPLRNMLELGSGRAPAPEPTALLALKDAERHAVVGGAAANTARDSAQDPVAELEKQMREINAQGVKRKAEEKRAAAAEKRANAANANTPTVCKRPAAAAPGAKRPVGRPTAAPAAPTGQAATFYANLLIEKPHYLEVDRKKGRSAFCSKAYVDAKKAGKDGKVAYESAGDAFDHAYPK